LNVRSSLARDDPVSICSSSSAKTEVASAKEINEINASDAANVRHRIIAIARRPWATFVCRVFVATHRLNYPSRLAGRRRRRIARNTKASAAVSQKTIETARDRRRARARANARARSRRRTTNGARAR
jgi:hypothetical protein